MHCTYIISCHESRYWGKLHLSTINVTSFLKTSFKGTCEYTRVFFFITIITGIYGVYGPVVSLHIFHVLLYLISIEYIFVPRILAAIWNQILHKQGQGWFDVHDDGGGQESFRPTVGHFDQLLVILIKVKCTVGQFLLSY